MACGAGQHRDWMSCRRFGRFCNKAERLLFALTFVFLIGCGGAATSSGTLKIAVLGPSFTGLNNDPRVYPNDVIDNPIQPDGRVRDNVNVYCTTPFPGQPSFKAQLTTAHGVQPFTYSATGQIPSSMQLDSATGQITYAGNCVDQGKQMSVSYHAVDSANRGTSPDMVVTYNVL